MLSQTLPGFNSPVAAIKWGRSYFPLSVRPETSFAPYGENGTVPFFSNGSLDPFPDYEEVKGGKEGLERNPRYLLHFSQ